MFLITKCKNILILTGLLIHHYSFANENQWIIPLKDQIKNIIQPYVLLILLNVSSVDISPQQRFYRHLMKEFPSYLIDISSKSHVLSKFSSLQLLENPRNTILYLVIDIKTEIVNQIENTIDIIHMLSPYNQRPKCLIITFGENITFGNSSSNILKYAWQKNFLDMTVLQIIDEELLKMQKLYVYNFNPFNNSLNKQTWHKAVDIFPDKMDNMYKHNMKVVAYDFPPYMHINRNSNGSIISLEGYDFAILKCLSEKLNFIVKPILVVNSKSIPKLVRSSCVALENGIVDMLSMPLTHSIFNYTRKVKNGIFLRRFEYVAVVPICVYRNSSLLFIYALNIAYIIFAIILINMMTLLFEFNKYYWKVDYIVRILFNYATPNSPERSSERVLFIFLMGLSFDLVNIWYNKLLNEAIIIEKYALNTLENIDNSNFPIYINLINAERFFQDNSTLSNNLRSKSIIVPKMEECYGILQKNRNVVCTDSKAHAKIYINKFKEIDGSLTMIVAEPSILSHPLTLFYESTSPYVEKFNEISQRIMESGIYFKEIEPFEKIWEMLDEKEVTHKKPALGFLLLVILFVGNIIAVIFFVIEWLVKLYSHLNFRLP